MVGTAGAGRGFGDIALSGLELGHEGLTETFSSFCEYETDQYVEGTLKVVTNAAIGNPYASEDEVTQMGWGGIAGSGVYGGDVDYSKESFDQAKKTRFPGSYELRRPGLRRLPGRIGGEDDAMRAP